MENHCGMRPTGLPNRDRQGGSSLDIKGPAEGPAESPAEGPEYVGG